jgi:signal transduction histidine kinase
VRGLAAPLLLWSLFAAVLVQPLRSWLRGSQGYDLWMMREWLEESRVWRDTVRDMAVDYLKTLDEAKADPDKNYQLALKGERLRENLRSLGIPPKMYAGQLPSFPVIYRLTLSFEAEPGAPLVTISWDSNLTRHPSQYRELHHPLAPRVWADVQYQLHAYNTQQQVEEAGTRKVRWVGALALAGTVLALLWVYLVHQRERDRQQQRAEAQHQVAQAEHLRLEEELRRRDAEQRHEETERKLLEQRLATQAAEQQALELKSQLYASIGIMAGSYAHNIKNLLVRPNDLLRRCLEVNGLSPDQDFMLREVRQTLGTVTERLQQILRTVRRDPSRPELTRLDLNQVVRDLYATWDDLARDKWKLTLTVELAAEPLWVEGDLSHVQQAVENLLFNARDATFEMRNHLRDEARSKDDLAPPDRRQALIAAAAWRGVVTLRTRRQGDRAVLEVHDNGIGMTEEVRRRCTETHFSTKRDNAIYEGNSTGMGLGLSFVTAILDHHKAMLEIVSQSGQGALLRASFPLAAAAIAGVAQGGRGAVEGEAAGAEARTSWVKG